MKIIIIGNGGHSKVIQDMISGLEGHHVYAVLDDKYTRANEERGIIYAPSFYLKQIISNDTKVVIAIGNNEIRKRMSMKFNLRDDQYISIIHPSAVVSQSAVLGYGTVVMPSAIINAEARIGDHCIINTGAIIEHESCIGHFSHISPNTTLTGNVLVGEGVHIGASATVIPGISIGDWSVIGAGSTVIENIPAYRKAVGCPTRLLNNVKGKEKTTDKVVM